MDLLLSSGITLKVVPINPFFSGDAGAALRKLHPEPQPPMQDVEGLNGKVLLEPNTANPEYQRSVYAYNRMINAIMFDWMMEDAVDLQLTDADRATVQAVRDSNSARGIQIEGSDKLVYIKYVAIRSATDLRKLRKAMEDEAFITEEDIAAKAEALKS